MGTVSVSSPLSFGIPLNYSSSLLPGARNTHKGPRAAPSKSKPKQSAKRREILLGGGDQTVKGDGHVRHALPTERVDTRTEKEIADVLVWVRASNSSTSS